MNPIRWLQTLMLSCTVGVTMGLPVAMAQVDRSALEREVTEAEKAFARSMAERRLDDFARHVAEHAVFFGPGEPLRGKAAVVAGWKAYFDGAQAPFSWGPDLVVVTGDGLLAHSTGLVRNPEGRPIGRFNSVWRRDADGQWRVLLDKGSPLSDAERRAP